MQPQLTTHCTDCHAIVYTYYLAHCILTHCTAKHTHGKIYNADPTLIFFFVEMTPTQSFRPSTKALY